MNENTDEVHENRAATLRNVLRVIARQVDVDTLCPNRILEIGGGPVPLCTFLKVKGIVVDPLAVFYRKQFRGFFDLNRYMYLTAIGETLPFRDGTFHLVLCDNVLEHVLSVPALLNEVRRVSEEGATVYIKVDLYTLRWNLFRGLLACFGVWYNVHHPHTLGRRKVEARIRQAGMTIVHTQTSQRYRVGWRRMVDFVLGTTQEAEYVIEVRDLGMAGSDSGKGRRCQL